jgi:hypothetical protein
MTEQSKSQNAKTPLPCHWVEDEGFEVIPTPGPANDPQALPDTAFLLKFNPFLPPPQFPPS